MVNQLFKVLIMHRIEIEDDLYEKLKTYSHNLNVSISELIKRFTEQTIEGGSVIKARRFFDNLTPLESFENIDPESYVRKIRETSRLNKAQSDDT